MSLILAMGTVPKDLEVKTFGLGKDPVLLGEYQISMDDWLEATWYVLTNTDLQPNDPRLGFIKRVQALGEVEGWSSGNRLARVPVEADLDNEFM